MAEPASTGFGIASILFPTDFSEASRVALEDATYWARTFGAHLHLMHAVVATGPYLDPNISPAVPPPEEMVAAWEEAARRSLEEVRRSLPAPAPPTALHARRAGVPADAILAMAEELRADLVVMASHGRRGFRRLLLGSVTEEVVRRAPCPVLVERRRAGARPAASPNRILVPIDFSEPSRRSVELARSLAAAFHAELDLLTVVHQPVYPAFYGTGEMPALVQLTAEVESLAQRKIAELQQELGGSVPSGTFLRRGDAALEIVEHARERSCGLTVLATHGLSGLDRALLGSVTEKVLRLAELPVLVVPPASGGAVR